MQGCNLFIPKKQLHSKTRPKWFTSTIQHKLNCVQSFRKKVKAHSTGPNISALAKAENSLQHEITSSKQAYKAELINQFEHSNSNKIFNYISSLTNTRGFPEAMTNGNKTATNDLEIVNCFNDYFYSVFIKEDSQPQQLENSEPPTVIDTISFSVTDVFNHLSTLDTTKATGIDSISPKLLKNCASSLSIPVHTLFMLSITSGSLPKEW